MKLTKSIITLAALALGATAALADQVVTLGNQTSGNTLELFSRDGDGNLTKKASIPTGGNGLGAGLGSQYAISYDRETQLLAAVNAGSNTVSIFKDNDGTPTLINTIPSQGQRPVSVALRGDRLFILNQGDGTHNSSVVGYQLVFGGTVALSTSVPLSANAFVNPGQIEFSPSGRSLVVTEKATNKIDVIDLNWGGTTASAKSYASSGQTPFGFEFDNAGHIVVSEAQGGAAGASTVSSYGRKQNGDLFAITASAATTQTAACWVAITPNGKWAFTTNAGAGTVSTFALARSGALTLANNSTAIAGSTPIDATVDRASKKLFVLEGGDNMIRTYTIAPNGGLTAVSGAATPSHPAGLAIID